MLFMILISPLVLHLKDILHHLLYSPRTQCPSSVKVNEGLMHRLQRQSTCLSILNAFYTNIFVMKKNPGLCAGIQHTYLMPNKAKSFFYTRCRLTDSSVTFLSPPPGTWWALSSEPTLEDTFHSSFLISICRAA